MIRKSRSRLFSRRPAALATSIAALLALAALPTKSPAADVIWDDGGTVFNFSDALNWAGDVAPVNGDKVILGDHVRFAGREPVVNDLVSLQALGLLFNGSNNNALNSYDLSGNTLFLGSSGIDNASGNSQILSLPLFLTASQTWNASAESLSIRGTVFNNGQTITIAGGFSSEITGVISGSGELVVNSTSALTLTGINIYQGATTLTSGNVIVTNADSLGRGEVVFNGGGLIADRTLTMTKEMTFNAGNHLIAATAGDVFSLEGTTNLRINAGANLIFGSGGATGTVVFGDLTGGLSINISATLRVANGTLRAGTFLNSITRSVASTTVDSGATLDTFGNNLEIQNLLGAGTLTNGEATAATYTVNSGNFTGTIQDGVGQVALTKDGTNTLTFSGTAFNSFTGPTNILAGEIALNGILSVNGGLRSAVINIGDGVGGVGTAVLRTTVFSEQIGDTSAITIANDGRLLLSTGFETVGSVAGTVNGQLNLLGASVTLFTGGTNTSTTFAGFILGAGSVTKDGTGTWTLSGANSYSGTTTINAGTVRTLSTSALGTGPVALNGGTLAVTGTLGTGAFTWNSGAIQLAPTAPTGNQVNVTGAFNDSVADTGGTYAFDLTGMTLGTTYTLTTFGSSNFTLGDFTAVGLDANTTVQGQFILNATSVQFTLQGLATTGSLIQNSAPTNTPTFVDFTVAGAATTGGPTENNTVGSLAFTPGSSLQIFNTLNVTNGPVNLVPTSSLNLGTSPLGNATLSASQLNVQNGASLTGNGTINGNLVNSGLVSPGNSPGTIYVTRNYTQTKTGTLRIEIRGTGAGDYDLLAVGGTASLDGTLQLVQLGRGPRLKVGERVTFLTAGEGVSGEFATVENGLVSDTILQPTVVYEEESVAVEAVRGSFEAYASDAGLTPNQRATAQALDSVSHDDLHNKALVYLDERTLGELPGDFDRIAPEELSSIFTISTALSQVQGTNLQRRTDDIRSGANGFSAAGLALNGQTPSYSGGLDFRTGAAGPTGDSKEMKESKEVTLDEKKWGAFLTGTGEWIDVSGDGNARGFDLTTGGFTLGLDYKVTPNFAVGVTAGYAGTAADLTEDGRVWVNGGKLGVYATYFTGGFYVDSAVTGGYNSYDTKRTALEGTARGSTEGGELNVLVGTGYDFKVGGLTVGPTATFNYTLVGMDGFTEHGSLAPLDIESREAESIRSALGLKASYDWRVGGMIIKPEVRAAWQHEYGDQSYDISASFAGGAGDSFLVNGPELGRDSLLLGAGFAVQCSATVSTYLYYDAELARDRYERHSLSAGVRVAF